MTCDLSFSHPSDSICLEPSLPPLHSNFNPSFPHPSDSICSEPSLPPLHSNFNITGQFKSKKSRCTECFFTSNPFSFCNSRCNLVIIEVNPNLWRSSLGSVVLKMRIITDNASVRIVSSEYLTTIWSITVKTELQKAKGRDILCCLNRFSASRGLSKAELSLWLSSMCMLTYGSTETLVLRVHFH